MTHGSLFSGVGGFDIAAEWCGWTNVFQCEKEPFCQRALKYFFPKTELYEDIKTTNFTKYRGTVDIVSGGFPCQPFSHAGKRKGAADDRYLWPEMLRVIREVQPAWVVAENVYGLLTQQQGMVFEQVCADLERAGYEVQPFIIPACAVDAPHRRDRIWIVAHRTDTGIESVPERENGVFKSETVADADKLYGHLPGLRAGEVPQFETSGIRDNIYRPDSHANKKRLKRWNGDRKTVLKALHQEFNFHSTSGGRGKNDKSVCAGQPGQNIPDWRKFPTQSPVRKRNDGFPNRVVRYITKELYYEISKTGKENRIENLPEVWERISQEEIWKEIRRFYSLESKDILLQTMQLYSGAYFGEIALSPFSDVFSEKILQHLRKYGEFRCSPHGRKLQKQRSIQFGNALSFLPHEVALAAKKIEKAAVSFNSWHRAESIRAFGSAIVPQVAYEFFKIINNLNNSQL